MPKFLFAGDFCGCNRLYDILSNKEYKFLFDEFKDVVHDVDYSIVNLESPIKIEGMDYYPIPKCGPNLFSSSNAVEALKYAGFNMCTLANNHIYDYGDKGVQDTITTLNKFSFDFIGAGKNIHEAEQIVYKIINDSRVAFINCCEYEYSIATESHYGAAPLNISKLYYLIKEASSNSDIVILLLHGGVEHYNYPTPQMQTNYRLLIDFGADIIINTHQHCISGYEQYKDGLIFYGLGNFCFDKGGGEETGWNYGLICIINTDVNPFGIELIPIIQNSTKLGVSVLTGKDRDSIMALISSINKTILDKKSLEEEYLSFQKKTQKEYTIVFNPFKSSFVNNLYVKGILPNLYSKQKLLFIQNMLTCDSHRDRLLNYIRNLIDSK